MGSADYAPIADYAAIGDCHTAALVSGQGSIDWYCPGRFDAPPVFWRLLDARRGGYFQVAPAMPGRAQRRYLPDTNVLETTFECPNGRVVLTDFMPIHRRQSHRLGHDVGTKHRILRLLQAEGEACPMELRFRPSFDFGRVDSSLKLVDGKGAVAHTGDQSLVLYAGKALLSPLLGGEVQGTFTLRPGERAWLALSLASRDEAVHHALSPDVSFRDLGRTVEYWQTWASNCRYQGRYRDAVVRSALALKLLTYEPTGAVVAAPTTSLPEIIGGIRNWDYRFTWLRDASLAVYALSSLGYDEEGTDFIAWLVNTCREDPMARPQIMYRIDGSVDIAESVLPGVEGYKGSQPVRIGNGAYRQQQLDVYGNILAAAYHFHHRIAQDSDLPLPEQVQRMPRRNWYLLRNLADRAAADWQLPDSGIWEVRGGLRHFVYSKLMCWAAVDRAIRFATEQHLKARLQRWAEVRDEIARCILDRGFNRDIGAFTQSLDDDHVDASVLAMPQYGFLPATDPRFVSTIDVIRQRLAYDSLLKRYEAPAGLTSGPEATFMMTSFWLVDALALCGRIEEARELFECLISHGNDLGLLSEEIDPYSETDRMLGNFPQGFSHMALINSAVNLSLASEKGAEHQPHTEPERAANAAPAAANAATD